MIRLLVSLLLMAALVATAPALPWVAGEAFAQSNDNDYTPLNSRIRRERQFPTEPRAASVDPSELSRFARRRNSNMVDYFARCIWNTSNENGLDLLARTDFGFRNWAQIGIERDEVRDHYPIRNCLRRVANQNFSGVRLSYTAESMRRWYIQAAYLDLYEDGPSWFLPGGELAEREYPLSERNPMVQVAMNLADCVVLGDPHGADLFYRTTPDSDEEFAALQALVPAIGPCIPQGQEFELDPFAMRVWIGEGLWHAANNLVPAGEAGQGGSE